MKRQILIFAFILCNFFCLSKASALPTLHLSNTSLVFIDSKLTQDIDYYILNDGSETGIATYSVSATESSLKDSHNSSVEIPVSFTLSPEKSIDLSREVISNTELKDSIKAKINKPAKAGVYSGKTTISFNDLSVVNTVSFNNRGNIITKTVNKNDKLTDVPIPDARENYSFDGWFTEESLTSGDKLAGNPIILSNTTYYAHWIKLDITVDVNISLNGYNNSTHHKLGAKFDIKTFDKDDNLLKNLTNVSDYYTSDNPNLGYYIISNVKVNPGYEFNKIYTCSVWDNDVNDCIKTHETEITDLGNGSYKILQNTEDYMAIYYDFTEKNYSITYNLDGGTNSISNPSTYTINDQITLQNPTKTGYTFTGWTVGKKVLSYDSILANNEFIENYTESTRADRYTRRGIFNVKPNTYYTLSTNLPKREDGGSYILMKASDAVDDFIASSTDGGYSNRPITVKSTESGHLLISFLNYLMEQDVKEKFDNGEYWFQIEEGDEATAHEEYISTPTKNIVIPEGSLGNRTYTANWSINKYTFTLNSATGATTTGSTATGSYNYGTTITLKGAANTGYDWTSWSGLPSGVTNSATTSFTMPASNVTVTPTVSLHNYTITYNLNSGSISGQPTKYTINTATFTLPTPTRTNYFFTGWTGSNGTNPQTSISIAKGSTGNRTYTANWSQYKSASYLAFTYAKKINFGVTANQTIKMQMQVYMTSTTGGDIFGCGTISGESKSFRFFNYSNKFYLDYGSGDGYNRIFGGTWNNNTLYNIEVGNRYVKNLSNNTNIISGTAVGNFDYTGCNISLNPVPSSTEGASGRIYYLKIWKNGTLVRDLVPKTRYDNVTGLWDNINSKFYTLS